MLPKNSPILMALLTAYCAMAAPVNTQPSQMRAVINTLKAQLKADNITDASAAVDAVKHSLRAIAARSETEIDDAMIDGLMVSERSHFSVSPLELQLESLNFWRCCI